MRVVIALGGNALIRRGEPMTASVQRENARSAALALAPLARDHELVLSHGNGPQVGLLALQAAAYTAVAAYPLDVLDAQTEGMIGYLIEQELGNLLAPGIPLATILTMIEVDPADPEFRNPTKFVGPQYPKDAADRIAAENGWTFRKDGDFLRRVVPSPRPTRIFEIRPIRWLLEKGTIVICAGGGGIPVISCKGNHKALAGVEAVIDKDFASSLLARELNADLFIMATDVAGAYAEWGTPAARLIRNTSPEELETLPFPEGSMGPKVNAACEFVQATGKRAAIGALNDILALVTGDSGTQVRTQKRKGENDA
ncbi:MAG: carbamate kinase [Methanoregulaceae archaeon]